MEMRWEQAMMRAVLSVFATIGLGAGLPSAAATPAELDVLQTREQIPGFVEPHTPGSGAPEEHALPAGGRIQQILGEEVDLNRVDYVRTRVAGAEAPRIVVVLIPGFLGGAATFDPYARDLVRALEGELEVWAVDRRSNQLEDRRGALHARGAAEIAAMEGDDEAVFQALSEGVRFYFPDADPDRDGVGGPGFELPDAFGDPSTFVVLRQEDLRPFAAHWGVDTYVRDWRELVLAARSAVGDAGIVLFGGHSMGTTWATVFAGYDFDPGPGVEAGHELIDGLILLEGGGADSPGPDAPTEAEYLAGITDLEEGTTEFLEGVDADVFLGSLFGLVNAVRLGAAGELNGLAGFFQPDAPSIVQTTPLFGSIALGFLLQAPVTNETLPGLFLDDDFSANPAFSASMGFSADGSNVVNPIQNLVPGEFYVALDEGTTRSWINYDSPRFDPSHPDPLTCPPIDPPPFPVFMEDVAETGCAIIDNGPKPGPGEPPAQWGLEREVTDIGVLIRSLFETGNASEWYFVSGRPGLDLAFGRDSSALGRPDLLNITRNAEVDVPVLAIGGSNGLTPTEGSFADYLGSIASTDQTVVILEGYSHLDVISADENEAVAPTAEFATRILTVPEPGELASAGAAMVALGLLARSRRRTRGAGV